jgi:hypothetical protein
LASGTAGAGSGLVWVKYSVDIVPPENVVFYSARTRKELLGFGFGVKRRRRRRRGNHILSGCKLETFLMASRWPSLIAINK